MAKEWSWSFSKKKNYDTCPKRHYEVDVLRNFTEDSEQLTWGNEVHKALAGGILYASGIPRSGSGRDMIEAKPLPQTMASYGHWVEEMADAPDKPGKVHVEQKFAITRDFQPTTYFAPNVWYRGVCDAMRVCDDTVLARDWKTGKVKHDSIQLMLMATCIFIHRPEIKRIKTEFIWLKEDCATPEVWSRSTIMKEWVSLIPQINAMEKAAQTLTYPPKPGKLCRAWCPVTSCPFHGKGG